MKSPEMVRQWARHEGFSSDETERFVRQHDGNAECINPTFRSVKIPPLNTLLIWSEDHNVLVAINNYGANIIPSDTHKDTP